MAELNFGLLNPPGSQNIGNAFVQGMDQAAVARAQENQNALSQYTLGKARREDELTNQLLGDLRGATTNDEIYRAYQRAGKPDVAFKMQRDATKQLLDGSTLIDKALDRYKGQVPGIQTPDAAAAYVQQTYADPIVGPYVSRLKPLDQAIEENVAQFTANPDRWRATHTNVGGLQILQSLQPKPQVVGSAIANMNPMAGQVGAPIPGAPPVSNQAKDLLIPGPDGTLVPNTALVSVRTNLAREGRAPAQPRPEQPPVAVVDPATGRTVYVSREEALRQRMTPASAMEGLPPKEIQKREAALPAATSAVTGFEKKSDNFIKDLQEGKQLTASFAAIDRRQAASDVQAAINQAIADIGGARTRTREAYDSTYAYKTPANSAAPSTAPVDMPSAAAAELAKRAAARR